MAKRSQAARDEKGCWDIGGGALEFGISAMDNVRKEIAEEYGVKPNRIDYLGYRDVMRNSEDKPTHWIALDFAALIDGEQPAINEPEKFDSSGWYPASDPPQPLHSQLADALARYKSAIVELGRAQSDPNRVRRS